MTTTDTQQRKTRTITLTDARPVKIYEDEWTLIAEASRHDGKVPIQANRHWFIKVREHADGRRIVHGGRIAGNGGIPIGERELRGGSLIPATDGKPDEAATIRAIREIADGVIDDVRLGDECIADLPPEEV